MLLVIPWYKCLLLDAAISTAINTINRNVASAATREQASYRGCLIVDEQMTGSGANSSLYR